MPQTGTIVNSQAEGRKPLIVTTDGGTDILNQYNVTMTPEGIVQLIGGAPDGHVHVQATTEGETIISVTGSGPFAGLVGEITVTVTADPGGPTGPGPLVLTLGTALPKL